MKVKALKYFRLDEMFRFVEKGEVIKVNNKIGKPLITAGLVEAANANATVGRQSIKAGVKIIKAAKENADSAKAERLAVSHKIFNEKKKESDKRIKKNITLINKGGDSGKSVQAKSPTSLRGAVTQ